jgi:hypothetical protein
MGGSVRPIPNATAVLTSLVLLFAACEDSTRLDTPVTFDVEPMPFPAPAPVTLASSAILGVGFLPNGTACAVSRNAMFLSADGGTTWSASAHPPAGDNIQVLAIDASGTIYLGADSALERLDPHEINPLSLDILRSTDAGATWKKVSSLNRPIVNAMVLACNGSGDVIAGYHTSGFAVSHNKGESWTTVPNYWCSGVAASTSRVLFTASVMGNVRRSDDLGASWSVCPGLPGEGLGSYGSMFVTSNADTIFVAELTEPGTLYRSTNGGWGWTPVWTGYGTNVSHSRRGVLYFATAEEVRRSTDGGTRWILAGKAGAEITSLAVSDSGVVLVGTIKGTVVRWRGE